MSRKAYFRRNSSIPITLRIDGIPKKIMPGERFISTVEMMGDLPGIAFEGFVDEAVTTILTPVNPIHMWEDMVAKAKEEADSEANATFLESITSAPEATPQITPQVTQEVTQEVKVPEKPIEERIVQNSGTHIVTHEAPVEVEQSKPTGFKPEILLELKKKERIAWATMKKHDLKKIMDEAGVDYSQIKDDRNDLFKFLYGIIKSL